MPLCSSRRLISSLCSFFNKDSKVLKKRKAKWSVAVSATESGFDMILDLNLVWYNLIFFCICCPTGDTVIVALPVCLFRRGPGIQQWNKDTALSRWHLLLSASRSFCSHITDVPLLHQHVLDSLYHSTGYRMKYLCSFSRWLGAKKV